MARKIPQVLRSTIRTHLSGPIHEAVRAISNQLVAKEGGESIKAILHYGSCLQKGDPYQGIVDLFVVVDDYRSYYGAGLPAMANRILPPNVFYEETRGRKGVVRAKYGVISIGQLKRAVSPEWFHSFFWARLAQPMRISFKRDGAILEECADISAQALMTLLDRTLPVVDSPFSVKGLWRRALGLTYRAELRPEGPERFKRLWQDSGPYFEAVTPLALSALSYPVRRISGNVQNGEGPFFEAMVDEKGARRCRYGWAARIAAGKALSVARLLKAAFTFSGGVDYALWKIERHTGKRIEVGPFMRRHPALAMILLSWRLIKNRAIH